MKAVFNTERVNYELIDSSYTRNGLCVQGELTLKQLTIGQPAVFEFKLNNHVQVIRTDIVIDIKECPITFKKEMDKQIHPYKISVVRQDGSINKLMKIGTEEEVRRYVKNRFPKEEVTYRIAPIPVRKKGVS